MRKTFYRQKNVYIRQEVHSPLQHNFPLSNFVGNPDQNFPNLILPNFLHRWILLKNFRMFKAKKIVLKSALFTFPNVKKKKTLAPQLINSIFNVPSGCHSEFVGIPSVRTHNHVLCFLNFGKEGPHRTSGRTTQHTVPK